MQVPLLLKASHWREIFERIRAVMRRIWLTTQRVVLHSRNAVGQGQAQRATGALSPERRKRPQRLPGVLPDMAESPAPEAVASNVFSGALWPLVGEPTDPYARRHRYDGSVPSPSLATAARIMAASSIQNGLEAKARSANKDKGA